MIELPDTIIERVKHTISRYQLFRKDELLVLALSGGKDSLLTAAILKRLGYRFVPAVVDMGYEEGWADRVQAVVSQLDFKASIVGIRSDELCGQLLDASRDDLNKRLQVLDELVVEHDRNATPCTQCYNCKIIALRTFMQAQQSNTLILGHHGTDAIASLLKSALMYVDRWDIHHACYDRDHFETLVDALLQELMVVIKDSPGGYETIPEISEALRSPLAPIMTRIRDLVDRRVAGTDEPPVQHLLEHRRIVRPLFDVFEHQIVEIVGRSGLTVEGSSCGHGLTQETETPREMVHNRVLRRLSTEPRGRQALGELLDWVRSGIHPDGTLKVEVRKERARLLGPEYRSGPGTGEKL